MKNLLAAMNAVMKSVGYVQKTGKNTFHNYKYAGEADLLEALRPAMVEQGLLLIPSLDGEPRMDDHGNTHLVMAYTLAHVSGEVWPEKIRVPGCGNDKSSKGVIGDKGPYKALTGANKYLLFKLFQIETGDDPENDSPEATTAKTQPAKQEPKSEDEKAALIGQTLGKVKKGPDHAIQEAKRIFPGKSIESRNDVVSKLTGAEVVKLCQEIEAA